MLTSGQEWKRHWIYQSAMWDVNGIEHDVSVDAKAGLDARSKNRNDFEISGGGFVVTGADDEAVNKMFEWVRMRVGFYGSTPSYWPVFEAHGSSLLFPEPTPPTIFADLM